MLDFSKWVDMWDAYNRMGEAVSGSPASICQGIGLTLMMVFGFVGLIAVAVIGGGGDNPEESPFFCLTTAIAVIGGVLALASFVMPSHNDAHVSEPPALSGLTAGASPVLHSDMGWQYRHPWWRERLGELGIRQSMSRKGNCLDNAATEQVFGHLKDEFYRDREFDS